MKKTNILQVLILVFSMSLLTVGCSSDKTESENSRTDLSYQESLKIEREGILTFEDNNYIVFKDKKSRKFNNRDFNYDIISNLKPLINQENKNDSETIVLYNSLDNTETLTYFNIEVIDENKLSFSALLSNGDELNNLIFESETSLTDGNENSRQFCWPCIEIVVSLIADVVIDAVTSSGEGIDMTQICLAQIEACYRSGGTPTNMQASSSWYGGESCSLDCIPN